MILENARIFSNSQVRKGAILIKNGIIKSIILEDNGTNFNKFIKQNDDGFQIDCGNRLILPGIIDIHSHLRDLEQKEKETFESSTLAAAFSGITTVFNMPNTKPPAITANQVKEWMIKAKERIYVDVGFISGIPNKIDGDEIKKIIDLGIIGFKIYPNNPINDVDWTIDSNLQNIFKISSEYNKTIFIHPEWPLTDAEKNEIISSTTKHSTLLELHDKLNPITIEEKYIEFVIENYKQFILENELDIERYPIIHFCHISNKESFLIIQKAMEIQKKFKISFEVTPHHLLLTNKVKLLNPNFGKVNPPLRSKPHSQFLFKKLKEGKIKLIGTDHAPHTIDEKSIKNPNAPSGFPGFETYPLLLLNKVFENELTLEKFVKVASENPAISFNLKNKGFIKENYDADLIIIERTTEYSINPQNFKTKAKYSPYENLKTTVQIWKVFLRGNEINTEKSLPKGRVIRL